jgi:F0F1-type ATP synthase membrane subunit c/vacuolar-type H+-ATPase subunit K
MAAGVENGAKAAGHCRTGGIGNGTLNGGGSLAVLFTVAGAGVGLRGRSATGQEIAARQPGRRDGRPADQLQHLPPVANSMSPAGVPAWPAVRREATLTLRVMAMGSQSA